MRPIFLAHLEAGFLIQFMWPRRFYPDKMRFSCLDFLSQVKQACYNYTRLGKTFLWSR